MLCWYTIYNSNELRLHQSDCIMQCLGSVIIALIGLHDVTRQLHTVSKHVDDNHHSNRDSY